MSKGKREAYIAGRIVSGAPMIDAILEAARLYPDSPCTNVREIVVEYLKDNGYDGLFLHDDIGRDGCQCLVDAELGLDCTGEYCRPGVLVGGKIVERT